MSRKKTITAAAGAAAVGGSIAAVAARRLRRSSAERIRIQRQATVVRLTVRNGARLVGARALGRVAGAERRAELEATATIRTAEDVARELGQMKGALMKVGQLVSFIVEALPDEAQEALAALQADAPPMAPSLAAQVVRDELGGDPERIFLDWSPEPVAAASIGQVHRAVTRDGRHVAVKVQYPGIRDAIAADLDNAEALYAVFAAFALKGLDTRALVDELRARMAEELDYRHESRNQQEFAAHYAGHPFIRIPGVLPELSAERVLTTEWVDGQNWATFVRTASDADRQRAGEVIWRFAQGSILRFGAFNGDPHPGNYLFRPGGQVTFLDFGLVKRYAPDEVQLFENLIQAFVIERDVPKFRRVLEENDILRPSDISDDDVREYFGHFYEFVESDEEIAFTPEYASETVRRMFDPSSPYAHVSRASNVPPAFVISQRINLGLHAVLGRLRAQRNWRRIAYELWPWVDGPPSTPMGEAEAEWMRSRGYQP